EFWSKGYFISTVGHHGDEAMLKKYVKNQGTGKNYKPLHQEDLYL
ncbi:MAG: transposase, partial [Candidatus Electryonea clarkiae]|nr:transposase [Candidatus Electryonea clarkiae]